MEDRVATTLWVLGPLEVVRDGEQVRLGSGQQRRVLAVLVVHANEVVSSDRLVDLLWGDEPPPSATHTLQGLVSRLRRTLGDDRLEPRAPGYRLRVASGEVDALRFEELVRVGLGSSDRAEVALGVFDEALGLWRGLPYAEFASEEFATAEVARLVELHARAIEERAAALLELGRPEDVIGELEAQIAVEPFRERLRALLMLALAHAGRPVESLRAYDEFRRRLTEEVGVVPSPGLQALNDDIVRQHPDVGWAGSPARDTGTADLPSGTVTFLFTEVEGSTRLWEELPDITRHVMPRHDKLLREAVESHDGFIVKTTGDGFFAVFATANDAVTAAVAAQRALVADDWNIAETVRVRMGIHTGGAEVRDGDYSGGAVNRASRLMSVANGGQIVVSTATEELLQNALPEKYGFVDLGEHRLRDLGQPERLFQVTHPDLGRDFAPLRTLDAFPTSNLPAQLDSFVGREGDVSEIAQVLREKRLVTLTGVGGVGKTRLALQVAGEVLARFRDGAWLCELAVVRDPTRVVDAVANVFQVAARPGMSLEESLVVYLAEQELLIVLDNCEHVLGPAATLVRAIEAACPRVRVLATSRESLSVRGEQLWSVPPLEVPEDTISPEAVGACEAVRLFVDRAEGVKAGFALDAGNAEAVAAVCRRLDGVPLAIELAAARITTMNPGELARRLDRRFGLLTGGDRDAIERHQTLRATIDWSYDLLTEPEQRLLDRLSVFAGGCTLEAAEAVCAGVSIDVDDVYELLAKLVARSLVVVDDTGPDTRYRLLETIRQYGEDRLAEHEETDTVRGRHCDWYSEFASAAQGHSFGPRQIEWGARLARDHDNLLAAMAFALATRDLERAMRLLRDLPCTLLQVDDVVILDPEPVLALPGAGDHPASSVALMLAAWQALRRGDGRRVSDLCDQALAAEARLGSIPDSHLAMFGSYLRGQVAQARALLATPGLLDISLQREAADHFVDASRHARADGLPSMTAFFLGSGAFVLGWLDPTAALPLGTEGLALARQTGAPIAITRNLIGLAEALALGDPQQARVLLDESLRLAAMLGYETPGLLNDAVFTAGRLLAWPTMFRTANRALHHQLRSGGTSPLFLAGILNLVARGLAEPRPEPAAVIQGTIGIVLYRATPNTATPDAGAAAQRSTVATPLAGVRRDTTELILAALGEQRMFELRAQGAAMTKDQAYTYARTHIDDYLATNPEPLP